MIKIKEKVGCGESEIYWKYFLEILGGKLQYTSRCMSEDNSNKNFTKVMIQNPHGNHYKYVAFDR